MRLINADELLTAFPVDDEPMVTKSSVRMTIRRMPTVEDAVEIVRCKDCKLNRKWNDWLGCPMIGIGTGVRDNDYCSRGIRKDG